MKSLPSARVVCVYEFRCVCVFITAVPITKLFAGGGGVESGGHVLRETDYEPRPV